MKSRAILFLSAALLITTVSFAQPKTGQKAADIALPDIKGKIAKLSDHAGKVVLVDFWASWCAPCRKANPGLARLYTKYKTKGFEIFSVSIDDDKKDWKKAVIADKMTWTQVNEQGGWDGPVAASWKIEQVPASYLLDKSGKIVAVDLPVKDLEKWIIQLLNRKS